MKFKDIEDRVFYSLVAPFNFDNFDSLPSTPFSDLAFIYRIIRSHDVDNVSMVTVDNGLMRWLGCTKEQLHEAASRNFPRLFPVYFETPGGDGIDEYDTSFPMMVTSWQHILGAAYMADSEFLAHIAAIWGDDVCIIPSSIHEIILMPSTSIDRMDTVNDMIYEVNSDPTLLKRSEILSNHAYFFPQGGQHVLTDTEYMDYFPPEPPLRM